MSMQNGNDEKSTDDPENSGSERNFAPGSLESAESYVARSLGTSPEGLGGSQAFANAFRAFLEWGESCSLICSSADYPFLRRAPEAKGNEHEVWFDQDSNRWFKATYPNKFGLGWSEEGFATAREYLTRLVLSNRHFGDDIRLVALVNQHEQLRVLTSQPHIAGEPATHEEICSWFIGLRFRRIESVAGLAWYRADLNLLVADAHEGNVIKAHDGSLYPIDLNIAEPTGQLLEWVRSATCSQ